MERPSTEVLNRLTSILQRGFLLQEVPFHGHTFVCKQVSLTEIRKTYHHLGILGRRGDKSILLKSGLAALSTVQVDGANLLPERFERLPALVRVFSSWSMPLLSKYISEINSLASMYVECLNSLGHFVGTSRSRFMWSTVQEGDLLSVKCTGWPGTENLLLSEVHRSWIFLNKSLDKWDAETEEWDKLKWYVACHSSEAAKGIGQIQEARRLRRENLGSFLSGSFEQDGAESLVDELHRSLSGEYDEHDGAVMETEKRFLNEYIERENSLRQREQEVLDGYMQDIEISSEETTNPSAVRGAIRVPHR